MAHSIEDDLVVSIEIKIERISQQLYLIIERCVEQRWIVRVYSYRYSCGVEVGQWMLGYARVDSQSHITRRAYLQGDALLDKVGNKRWILDCPDAMPETLSTQYLYSSPDASRSNCLSRMRNAVQSSFTGFLKPCCILLRWMSNLGSTES